MYASQRSVALEAVMLQIVRNLIVYCLALQSAIPANLKEGLPSLNSELCPSL